MEKTSERPGLEMQFSSLCRFSQFLGKSPAPSIQATCLGLPLSCPEAEAVGDTRGRHYYSVKTVCMAQTSRSRVSELVFIEEKYNDDPSC